MNSEDSTAERPSPPKRLQISKRYPGLCALPQRRGIPKTILKPDTTIGSSLLERLPPEIRNIIYELVLIDPDYALRVRSRHAELSDRADAGVARHALTRVSRAIRSECLRMWYERNVFAFRSLLDVEVWIRIIADAGKWLRKVVLAEGAVEVCVLLHLCCADC